MESISLSHVIFATNHRSFHKRRKHPGIPTHTRRKLHAQYRQLVRFGVVKSHRKSDFQDFQVYAKPSRLLEATELNVCTETSLEKILASFNMGRSQSLYKVKLQTSNAYGSNLSDLNSGIAICLIDANGDSILQRIPVIVNSWSVKSADIEEGDTLHFQRGSVDEFTFEGPKLGRIEALWISVESGQWRLGGASLTVIGACQPSLEENDDGEKKLYSGFQYEFEADDVLLGEASDMSLVELRPCLVSELSGVDLFTLLSISPSKSASMAVVRISNEESMREYADLKLSLLIYDATLIFVGTTIANFSAGDKAAFAFFVGGIAGFSYLLLLQRTVDGLRASSSISKNMGWFKRFLGGFKGPISSIALPLGFSLVAVKYSGIGDYQMVLTPKEVLAGMMGFLACKVAVVLAAFKPMTPTLKENK